MHVENLRIGMWVRIEGLRSYRFSIPEEAYLWGSQVDSARRWLQQLGGLPLQVVACQYPFLLANAGPIGTVMLDLRFLVVGKCEEKFRQVVARIRAKSQQAAQPVIGPSHPPEPCGRCQCQACTNQDDDDDDDDEWEPVDG